MDKKTFIRHLSETAYNVGFGAKKHFATYDVVSKAPGVIGFLSLAFGVISLVFDGVDVRILSAFFVILGIAGISISHYEETKEEYAKKGKQLTDIFNELKMMRTRINGQEHVAPEDTKRLGEIEKEYTEISKSKQITGSNWYAHYKFFWEQQIKWLESDLELSFFRDKIPLSFTVFVLAIVGVLVIYFASIINFLCGRIG